MKKYWKRNHIFITLLSFFAIVICIYLSEATANVPVMDYWRYISRLANKMYTSGLSFSDVYNNNGVHHSPIQLILFGLNVKIFHLNTLVEIYLGAIVFCISLIPIYNWYCKHVNRNNKLYWPFIICLMISFFSLSQWEILTLEFSLAFAIRQLMYVLCFLFTEKMLRNDEVYGKYAIDLAFVYIIVICSNSAYFVAFGAALSLIIIFDFLSNTKENRKKYLLQYIILGGGMFLGLILYYCLGNKESRGAATLGIPKIQEIIKGVLYIFGSSAVGDNSNHKFILILGGMAIVLTVVCVTLYFKEHIYQETYFPIVLLAYGFFQIISIMIGRVGAYSAEYLISSRYSFDTKWILVADICIVAIWISRKDKNITVLTHDRLKILTIVICLCFILIGILANNRNEKSIAPYRKQYFNNMIEKMIKTETLSDNDLTDFQADPNDVREGINLMKKYKLGIFSNIKTSEE
ncbi:MAG: hypothetical protein PHX08_04880 [Lachnospiraceae bacterium]|nr:hypothetical protein [Lachnospiraceae bacterium]